MKAAPSCHPAAIKSADWRRKHPEAAAKNIKRANNKATEKNILRRHSAVMTDFVRRAYLKDIARHLAKGRCIADIVVWTNLPLSVVQSAVEQIQVGRAKLIFPQIPTPKRNRIYNEKQNIRRSNWFARTH